MHAILLLLLLAVTAESWAQEAGVLRCSLHGPDTIRFVDDHYLPSSFVLDITVRNTGTQDLTQIRVFILSSQRFTLLSPASVTIDSLRAGESIDLTGDASFQLQPIAADRDETDTVRVFVSKGTEIASCLLPVHIERERRPRLELTCLTPDALRFDELLNDYVPNPFPVTTILRNTGDGPASDCRIDFTGPARISPADGFTSIAVGRLDAGREFEYLWWMQPRRRDTGGNDTVRFDAHGRGGIGGRIVTTTCSNTLFIPAVRAAEYTCTLEIDAVRYDGSGKQYAPDPFMVRARVTNIGQGIAEGLRMHTVLEDGLFFAPGQSAIDTIAGTLLPGQSLGPFVKSVRPLWSHGGDTLRITVMFIDRFGNTAACEGRMWIPPAESPSLTVDCASELDTLVLDPRTGSYLQSQFTLHARIANTGEDPVFNVALHAFPDPDGVLIIDPRDRERRISSALSPADGMRAASWTVRSTPSTIDRVVRLHVLGVGQLADGQYVPLVHCDIPVFVPHVGEPQLHCDLSTSVTDAGGDMIVDFDTVRADYEGEPSNFGAYTVFTIAARVTNTGTAVASNVSASLMLPARLVLEEGEMITKTTTPAEIPIGGEGYVSWTVHARHADTDTTVTVEMVVSERQTAPVQCAMDLGIAEALHVVSVTIPRDLTGVSGGVFNVPVIIGPSEGVEPGAYQLLVRFDPSVLRFRGATGEGTLTAYNWRHLDARVLDERPFGTPSVLVISDSTLFTPTPRNEPAPLVRLQFDVIDRGGAPHEADYIVRTALEFIRYPSMMADGTVITPYIRPHATATGRKLTPLFRDGEAILSGGCVFPLNASARLYPGRPNPFNPITDIPFHLSEASPYRLVLLDGHGRVLRVIVEGIADAGEHHVRLHADDLPSGVYFCRLEIAGIHRVQRLVLVK